MAKLQAAIALLPDAELSNRLGAAALAAHTASRGRLRWPRLPGHLSLKQPFGVEFGVESLAMVEGIVDGLAGELGAVDVRLGALEVKSPSPGNPEAVLWVGVEASPALLELERRIEGALSASATVVAAAPPADVAVPFVSEAYRFHVTLGFLPTGSLGQQELGAAAPLPALAGTTGRFSELGVFVYDGLPRAGWQCMLLARRALAKSRLE
jgi:hypothetical protein